MTDCSDSTNASSDEGLDSTDTEECKTCRLTLNMFIISPQLFIKLSLQDAKTRQRQG